MGEGPRAASVDGLGGERVCCDCHNDAMVFLAIAIANGELDCAVGAEDHR